MYSKLMQVYEVGFEFDMLHSLACHIYHMGADSKVLWNFLLGIYCRSDIIFNKNKIDGCVRVTSNIVLHIVKYKKVINYCLTLK
jgi:hypothetical protein